MDKAVCYVLVGIATLCWSLLLWLVVMDSYAIGRWCYACW